MIDSDLVAVVVASVIAVVLLILYVVASWRERGQNPHWSAEVYLCFDPAAPAPNAPKLASDFDARIASLEQVEVYLAAGGSAHGYGYVSSDGKTLGAVVGAMPTGVGLGGLTAVKWPCADLPSPVGVWLYGAKPRRGTRGVIPFSCAHWFQPA